MVLVYTLLFFPASDSLQQVETERSIYPGRKVQTSINPGEWRLAVCFPSASLGSITLFLAGEFKGNPGTAEKAMTTGRK